MKTTRILALPAIAAAAVLTMTGCFQLPGAPTTPNPTTPAETGGTSGGGGGTESAGDLAGTSWTGSTEVQPDVAFTLNADGTVDFSSWGGDSFDSPADVWSGDAASVTITVTQIVDQSSGESIDITYSGPAENGSMNLQGEGTDGNSYTLTATQS
ncbi:hypothetical protein [Agrococcus sp. SGAir0287]|uniref:hypothetical protein n=1 Tax=Agrococcus sp. SGAir0287 TaxID=2070347 RepID=UPI0010F5A5A3|nr:hypothetical protein [Agrococcus sp. SGAir0287]